MAKYYKKISDEDGNEFLLAVNITGHGAPTEDTEAEPGMCYLDEDSEHGDLYKCIGVLVTETGTVYRWKKLAGQEEVERIEKAIADLPQADWNQNDETAKDYVKNRPFWTDDPVEKTIIPEMTATWKIYESVVLEPIEIIPGAVYKVYWDGTLYECTAYYNDDVDVAIGNGILAGIGENGEKGEPFCIYVFDGETWIDAEQTGEHTLKLNAIIAETHKIDSLYLPAASSETQGVVSYNDITNHITSVDECRLMVGITTYGDLVSHLKKSVYPIVIPDVEYKDINGEYHYYSSVFRVESWYVSIASHYQVIMEISDNYGGGFSSISCQFPLNEADGCDDDAVLERIDFACNNEGLIIKSSNDKQFLITVDDNGAIKATEVMFTANATE